MICMRHAQAVRSGGRLQVITTPLSIIHEVLKHFHQPGRALGTEERQLYLGVLRVKGMLGIDESCCASALLHLRHGMQRQRRLAAALRPIHL